VTAGANRIRAGGPNRRINQANIIHSRFPSRRRGKFCYFRLKTCRTPVPVMVGMIG
jgi:hypothetical protein